MKTSEQRTQKQDKSIENKDLNLERENEVLKHKVEELEAKVNFYEEQFRMATHQKYGASSEKSDPEQLTAFNEAEKLSAQPSEEPEIETVLKKRSTKRSKGKKTYDDLPVEEIKYTLSEEERICPNCDSSLHEMKTEVRKELKIIPAQVKVVHHIRQVYACRNCDANGETGTIITAPMPGPVLAGSMVSPSLLANIMEKKYDHAMPLYRQERVFKNYGIDISRQNMAGWVVKGANIWLSQIYERLHAYLKEEDIIHADESPLQVLDEKKNKKNYMWLYASAKAGVHPIYLYEYQPSRSQNHPQNFLSGWGGYLQTDGYAGYNGVKEAVRVGCLAHARRKYTDAIKALPEDADIALTKSKEGLAFINRIYSLEKEFKEHSFEDRYEKRLEKTKNIFENYKAWLIEQKERTLPKSKLGQAITYSLKQWDNLTAFMLDGRIEVDNNRAERAIKPFVIGRKNYLFSKSPKGAQASAITYSIIETAKAHGLKPFDYLQYLFEKLPNLDTTNPEDLDALLPWADSLPDEISLNPNEKN